MMKRFLWQKQARGIAALVMAIAVLATLVGLGSNTGIASAASTTPKDFHVVALTKTNRNCDGSLAGPVQFQQFGFVILQERRSFRFFDEFSGRFRFRRTLTAEIVLRHAMPDTTYNVRLIQTPSGFNCGMVEAVIHTNDFGNGFVFIRERLRPDTQDAFVAINRASDFTDFFTTRDVFFFDECC